MLIYVKKSFRLALGGRYGGKPLANPFLKLPKKITALAVVVPEKKEKKVFGYPNFTTVSTPATRSQHRSSPRSVRVFLGLYYMVRMLCIKIGWEFSFMDELTTAGYRY